MKEDPLKRLIQEARFETTPGFTDSVMEKLESRIQAQMKIRLYFLLAGIGLFFALAVFTLIWWEIKLQAFGLDLRLPQEMMMVLFSMAVYLPLLQLFKLLQLGSVPQAGMS